MDRPHRESASVRVAGSLPGPRAQRWIAAFEAGSAPSTYVYPFVWDVSEWAEGPFCGDPDGNIFLDCCTHVASAPLGYNHPRILTECGVPFDPIKTADHDFYLAVGPDPARPRPLRLPAEAGRFRTAGHLQQKLFDLSRGFGFDTAFFVNSGAEAVENAVKIAMHHCWQRLCQRWPAALLEELCRQLHLPWHPYLTEARTNYPLFGIAMSGAFHGRTLGALSLTNSRTVQREGYAAIPWVRFAPYNDVAFDFDKLLDQRDLAAIVEAGEAARVIYEQQKAPRDLLAYVIAEPLQGEGGYIIGETAFLRRLADFAHRHEALYISDEVQTGLGRSGRFWAIEHHGVAADIVAAAKGLRVGAVLSKRQHFPSQPGAISSTWAGGPIATAVAVSTLEVIEDEQLMGNAEILGQEARSALQAVAERHAAMTNVRGLGLMLAFDLPGAAERAAMVQACFQRGLLLLGCGSRGVRLLPPLNLRPRELRLAVTLLEDALRDVERG
ncbi:MAG: aminotransferase class III-fold pyridoxal phosphate-dependent enzyme [Candidatus Tectomicrobia bacterium]|nr:aminotransferase class III-fold pyridoxal phosphate-dependent enzyme [Candidatus Tectomicrobia bacterium]